MKNYQQLKQIFTRLSHMQYMQRILMWDESVMMPTGAGEYRSNALATLGRTMQKMLANKTTKKYIEAAYQEKNENDKSFSTWDEVNLTKIEKIYKLANCIPVKLNERAIKTTLACEQAWRSMRAQNNWDGFLPYLEKSFQLNKEIAERQSQVLNLNVYDTLIDKYACGFNQANIDPVFDYLKQSLPPLIQQIMEKQKQNESVKKPVGPFLVEKQKLLGLTVMDALGFDFNYGRLDVSHHPFCTGSKEDARITTRYNEKEFNSSLMGICHETGHALYEQNLPDEWKDQPVGHIDNMAMHESQSLLMEMQVCRSFAFFEFILPIVKHELGDQEAFTVENLHRLAINVKPGYIRVDADEVTYPLHVILRYEIEKALFNNEITVKDLPYHWNERMMRYLGLSTQDNDQNGVMQDVHWPAGLFGYFPAYTLGRLIAAQLFAAYKNINPQYLQQLSSGNFKPLRLWLNDNVCRYAASLSANDLLRTVTGDALDPAFFIQHIHERYL